MICAHCSSPVADEARFCHSCGSLVSDAEGQAAATAAMDMSSFRNMEQLLRDDTKGEYIVGNMLGKGGMAVVYLATETQLSRKVALKVLPPELTFGHGVERFKREAKTAAALDHPNIIPIYRIASSGKLFWYAMKYLEGKSLEDMLRERGAFPLGETIEILEQVADALDYAHEHQVIHRDIKPANVMLDNRNRVVVTDFGIAKALTEGKLTATDSVIGTPYFMSPEQGMGKTVSGASDQYSVAVMAYRMLAGHVPFDGDSAIDILHKHCMFPAPLLHDDMPELPQHVSDAIARSLSKKGEERFASVHDLVQSMKDADFVPKAATRPSLATVLMDPADSKKVRAGTSGPRAHTGKGRTVASPAGAGPKPTSRAAASAARAPIAAAPKPKTGMYAGVGLAVVALVGIGYWQMRPAAGAAGPAPSSLTAPITNPAPANTPLVGSSDQGAATGAGAEATPTETKAPTKEPTNTPETKAPTKVATPPRSNVPVTRQQPPPQASSNSPVQRAPDPVPTNTPPATSQPVVENTLGTLQLLLTTPGLLEIDGKDYGERSRYKLDLASGTHVVRVRKDGFVSQTQIVDIKVGSIATLRFTLEPNP